MITGLRVEYRLLKLLNILCRWVFHSFAPYCAIQYLYTTITYVFQSFDVTNMSV